MSNPNPSESLRNTDVVRWRGGRCERTADALVVEEPLEIRVNEAPLAVTMRTPGADEALAVGFLVTEGILATRDELYDVTRCADPDHPELRNIANVVVADSVNVSGAEVGRRRYATSSCGICGAASIKALRKLAPPITAKPRLRREMLASLPDRMRAGQRLFERTGGLHAAGLFSAGGEMLLVEEDIGRHNAVDKVVGRAFLSGIWPLEASILMASGRAGFEIIQKALVARIPVVCSVSAPSSLAVELARESGMILVGFLRGDAMNVYTGADSID